MLFSLLILVCISTFSSTTTLSSEIEAQTSINNTNGARQHQDFIGSKIIIEENQKDDAISDRKDSFTDKTRLLGRIREARSERLKELREKLKEIRNKKLNENEADVYKINLNLPIQVGEETSLKNNVGYQQVDAQGLLPNGNTETASSTLVDVVSGNPRPSYAAESTYATVDNNNNFNNINNNNNNNNLPLSMGKSLSSPSGQAGINYSPPNNNLIDNRLFNPTPFYENQDQFNRLKPRAIVNSGGENALQYKPVSTTSIEDSSNLMVSHEKPINGMQMQQSSINNVNHHNRQQQHQYHNIQANEPNGYEQEQNQNQNQNQKISVIDEQQNYIPANQGEPTYDYGLVKDHQGNNNNVIRNQKQQQRLFESTSSSSSKNRDTDDMNMASGFNDHQMEPQFDDENYGLRQQAFTQQHKIDKSQQEQQQFAENNDFTMKSEFDDNSDTDKSLINNDGKYNSDNKQDSSDNLSLDKNEDFALERKSSPATGLLGQETMQRHDDYEEHHHHEAKCAEKEEEHHHYEMPAPVKKEIIVKKEEKHHHHHHHHHHHEPKKHEIKHVVKKEKIVQPVHLEIHIKGKGKNKSKKKGKKKKGKGKKKEKQGEEIYIKFHQDSHKHDGGHEMHSHEMHGHEMHDGGGHHEGDEYKVDEGSVEDKTSLIDDNPSQNAGGSNENNDGNSIANALPVAEQGEQGQQEGGGQQGVGEIENINTSEVPKEEHNTATGDAGGEEGDGEQQQEVEPKKVENDEKQVGEKEAHKLIKKNKIKIKSKHAKKEKEKEKVVVKQEPVVVKQEELRKHEEKKVEKVEQKEQHKVIKEKPHVEKQHTVKQEKPVEKEEKKIFELHEHKHYEHHEHINLHKPEEEQHHHEGELPPEHHEQLYHEPEPIQHHHHGIENSKEMHNLGGGGGGGYHHEYQHNPMPPLHEEHSADYHGHEPIPIKEHWFVPNLVEKPGQPVMVEMNNNNNNNHHHHHHQQHEHNDIEQAPIIIEDHSELERHNMNHPPIGVSYSEINHPFGFGLTPVSNKGLFASYSTTTATHVAHNASLPANSTTLTSSNSTTNHKKAEIVFENLKSMKKTNSTDTKIN